MPCPALCLCVSSILLIILLAEEGTGFVLVVHLFVSYAHVNLCHFFSSSWCRWLGEASVCGSFLTFLFTFFYQSLSNDRRLEAEIANVSKFAFSGVGLLFHVCAAEQIGREIILSLAVLEKKKYMWALILENGI